MQISTWNQRPKTSTALTASICLFAALALPAAANPITEGYILSGDNAQIHYLRARSASAEHSLLFIPGWRVSASIWSKQITYFSSRGYDIVAIDSRSQGGSTVARRGNAPEDRASDIQHVIAGLHLAHVALVGWSQGAQDVSAYVNRFGTDALDALALIDSPVSSGSTDATDNSVFVKIIL
ncbi:MAG TPA: alpha/beta hydrolase, partial [Steroidobacteraceae bacterium]